MILKYDAPCCNWFVFEGDKSLPAQLTDRRGGRGIKDRYAARVQDSPRHVDAAMISLFITFAEAERGLSQNSLLDAEDPLLQEVAAGAHAVPDRMATNKEGFISRIAGSARDTSTVHLSGQARAGPAGVIFGNSGNWP